jgi:glycosyltransferase involved in cell wall biosynthesis
VRVLHLSAANRWTGAAGPAFAEVQSLRAVGVDAHYAYVGGYKLQDKLHDVPFAHALIDKAQNPLSFRSSARRIRAFIEEQSIDVVHAHLTWDHWLAWFAMRGMASRPLLARTFHSRRTLRSDPLTRFLVRRTGIVATVNETFIDLPLIRDRGPLLTPPPLDESFFRPAGPNVREQYGLPHDVPVVTAIGKLAPERGFEDVLRAFALLRDVSRARLLVIGHGPHRETLETLAAALGVADAVTWAGYREDDLPEHYRAADIMLFTARGSDEGHRAVIEAMGCGVPVISYPIEGVDALLGELAPRLMSSEGTPVAIASTALTVLVSRSPAFREDCSRAMSRFHLGPSGNRLLDAYRSFLERPPR